MIHDRVSNSIATMLIGGSLSIPSAVLSSAKFSRFMPPRIYFFSYTSDGYLTTNLRLLALPIFTHICINSQSQIIALSTTLLYCTLPHESL